MYNKFTTKKNYIIKKKSVYHLQCLCPPQVCVPLVGKDNYINWHQRIPQTQHLSLWPQLLWEFTENENDWPVNLSPPGEKPFSFTAHVQIITKKKAFRQKDITNSTRPTSRAFLPADFNAEQMWNLSSFSRKLNLLIVHLKVHTKSLLTAIQYNLFLLFLNALY